VVLCSMMEAQWNSSNSTANCQQTGKLYNYRQGETSFLTNSLPAWLNSDCATWHSSSQCCRNAVKPLAGPYVERLQQP
jgi:hypothetical protein